MLRGGRRVTLYHRSMDDAADRAAHSATELGRRLGVDRHDVLVVLGSGLSHAGELLADGQDAHPLDTLPFWPAQTASGHRALAWSVLLGGRRVLVLGGRSHLYEGLDPVEVVHPIRTGIATGTGIVILTTAVGGIRPDLEPGSVMVVEDHLNLTGRSPLVGPACIDMVDAYAPTLRARTRHPATGRSCPRHRARCLRPRAWPSVRDAGRGRMRCASWGPTWWACPWPSRQLPPAMPGPTCSDWPW